MTGDSIFSEAHETFRTRFKQFLQSEVIPYIGDWEQNRIVPRSVWQNLGKEGYLCPWIAKEYGGQGLDLIYSLVVNEELAKTNQSGLMVYLHSDIVAPYIDTFGTEAQKQRYLPGCISGEIIMAVAMTEPDAGSDLASITTTAVEDQGEIVINGSKTFISNGLNCGLVIVAARDTTIENPHKSLSLYLVEEGTPGFKKGAKIEKMGMHSQDTAELFFTDCKIPKENRLGDKGRGFAMLMKKLQQERLMVALQAVNISEYALDWLADQYSNPEKTSFPITKTQAVQFALAEMATEIKIGKTFVHTLVVQHLRKMELSTESSMAKYWTTDLLRRTIGRCLDIIGSGAGREDCPLVRTWRDAQVYPIFAGTNEIMKSIVARKLFQ
jgi:alkylation response protein AidB-like acyl-CoA dehydrogenase